MGWESTTLRRIPITSRRPRPKRQQPNRKLVQFAGRLQAAPHKVGRRHRCRWPVWQGRVGVGEPRNPNPLSGLPDRAPPDHRVRARLNARPQLAHVLVEREPIDGVTRSVGHRSPRCRSVSERQCCRVGAAAGPARPENTGCPMWTACSAPLVSSSKGRLGRTRVSSVNALSDRCHYPSTGPAVRSSGQVGRPPWCPCGRARRDATC